MLCCACPTSLSGFPTYSGDYVDDFLGGFRQDVAPISASLWFVLLRVLRVPLSWSKCSWSSECTWIGWDINLETWMCGLPSIKVSKVLAQIEELLTAGPRLSSRLWNQLLGACCGSLASGQFFDLCLLHCMRPCSGFPLLRLVSAPNYGPPFDVTWMMTAPSGGR